MLSDVNMESTSVDIHLADDAGCLVMTMSTASGQRLYEIPLSDARALSLELVKQASRAELRGHRRPEVERSRIKWKR